MQKLITIPEAARLLRISISSLYRLTSKKKIPFVKIGARVVFKESSLERFLSSRTINGEHDE